MVFFLIFLSLLSLQKTKCEETWKLIQHFNNFVLWIVSEIVVLVRLSEVFFVFIFVGAEEERERERERERREEEGRKLEKRKKREKKEEKKRREKKEEKNNEKKKASVKNRKFMRIGKWCLKLGNLFAAKAIYSGVTHPAISRMTNTFAEFSQFCLFNSFFLKKNF